MSRSLPRARRARSPLTVAATAAMLLAPIGALAAPTGASAAPGPLVLTGTNGGNLLGSAGDFNGDGKTDVLYRAYDTTVVVIFGASTPPVGVDPTLELGTRAISYRIPSGAALWGATAAGDVDHDGLGDIVVVTDKGDYVVYGTTAGAGTTTELAAGPGITAVTPRPL
ncbi:MAG: VCBS repeat-containing protein, partial [Solirubrobacteraceae bacterium]